MTALDDLTRKLGLLQIVAADAAKNWARRTREEKKKRTTWDAAAIIAAMAVFPSRFKPTKYVYTGVSAQSLVETIEKDVD